MGEWSVNNWLGSSPSSSSYETYPLIYLTGSASVNVLMSDSNILNSGAGILGNAGTGAATIAIANSTYSNSSNTAAIFNNSSSGSLTYSLAGFSYTGASALTSGTCTLSTSANVALNKVTAGAGFQDQTSGHTNAPSAFDGSGNIVPITVGSGLTYNTSTKTLTASGGSYSAGTGLSLSGTTFSLTSPVSVANGGTGQTSLTSGSIMIGNGTGAITLLAPGTGVATGLAANVNAGSGFVTASSAASTYAPLNSPTFTGTPTVTPYSFNVGGTNGFDVDQCTSNGNFVYTVFGPYNSAVGGDKSSQLNITNNSNSGFAKFRLGLLSPATVATAEIGLSGTGAGFLPGTLYLSTFQATDIVIAPNVAASLICKSGGDVLIGTTTDDGTDKLQVNGSATMSSLTLGGGTKVTEMKVITGTLGSGAATLSDASITTTSAIIVTHLGSSVTNAGALFAYPTGTGTAAVKSTNGSDNDTFTAMVVDH